MGSFIRPLVRVPACYGAEKISQFGWVDVLEDVQIDPMKTILLSIVLARQLLGGS